MLEHRAGDQHLAFPTSNRCHHKDVAPAGFSSIDRVKGWRGESLGASLASTSLKDLRSTHASLRSGVRWRPPEWRRPSSFGSGAIWTVDGSLIKILWARAAQFRKCHTFFQAMRGPLFEREDLPHRSRAISMRLPSLYVGPLGKGEERTAVSAVRASGWRGLNLQGTKNFVWRSRCAAQVNCSLLTCLSVGQRWGRLSESQPAGRDTERSPRLHVYMVPVQG